MTPNLVPRDDPLTWRWKVVQSSLPRAVQIAYRRLGISLVIALVGGLLSLCLPSPVMPVGIVIVVAFAFNARRVNIQRFEEAIKLEVLRRTGEKPEISSESLRLNCIPTFDVSIGKVAQFGSAVHFPWVISAGLIAASLSFALGIHQITGGEYLIMTFVMACLFFIDYVFVTSKSISICRAFVRALTGSNPTMTVYPREDYSLMPHQSTEPIAVDATPVE